ncbi:hypothetical protein K432DRAFT_392673 [Lepidopterella palustris CBS 459.81]|uniref:Uncharacterized protein n=1 Tax=Lepidopterella palustris CBS 459.81 TaxID=1314670 RepID=A0A8E2EB97_9PEZI|nr:hypothetical protein K432DRAFT_392673 [Lepidopterella palustris CBS 459.81]
MLSTLATPQSARPGINPNRADKGDALAFGRPEKGESDRQHECLACTPIQGCLSAYETPVCGSKPPTMVTALGDHDSDRRETQTPTPTLSSTQLTSKAVGTRLKHQILSSSIPSLDLRNRGLAALSGVHTLNSKRKHNNLEERLPDTRARYLESGIWRGGVVNHRSTSVVLPLHTPQRAVLE